MVCLAKRLLIYIRKLGRDVDFDGHYNFDPVSEKDDPPVGVAERPRLVVKVDKQISCAVR